MDNYKRLISSMTKETKAKSIEYTKQCFQKYSVVLNKSFL